MEDEMALLKSLTFTTMPTLGGNPTLDRRARVIARLEEQKLILKDPNYEHTQLVVTASAHRDLVCSKSFRLARPGPRATLPLALGSTLN
jgi:hypothetical protein